MITKEMSRVRLCVDGALRRQTVAAAGIAVFVYGSPGGRVLLRRAGRYLGCLNSSFEAELIFLEFGLDEVMRRVDGG